MRDLVVLWALNTITIESPSIARAITIPKAQGSSVKPGILSLDVAKA